MKRIISFMITALMSISILFLGCIPKPAPPINTPKIPEGANPLSRVSPQSEYIGRVVCARDGIQKEILSVDPTGQNSIKIYSGEMYMPSSTGQRIIFGNPKGIYTATSDARNLKLILPGYKLYERPALTDGGNAFVFLGKGINDKRKFVYLMGMQDVNPIRLNIMEEVRCVSFLDNNNIIYSRKIMSNGKNVYQLFKYNIQNNIEKRLLKTSNNDLYSVASPDSTKIAFISYKDKGHGLYVLSTQTGRIKAINTSDLVIRDSIRWSTNNSDLLYITSNNKIKVSNIDRGFTKDIGDGYIATFSGNSSSITYGVYDNINSKQLIYRHMLSDGKRNKIMEFREDKKYPRSIKLLSWSSHMGI